LGEDVHPVSLIECAAAVYVVTSQMGFEGLLWGKRVRTFGMPFYAGWGLTQDDLPAPGRRRPATLEALVHAALVEYPRYLDPQTGRRCEVERLIEWMGLQRRMRERIPAGGVTAGDR
ncbi:MAG: capsular polysaccharide biosynthesis protein, partial [Burkholderiales bacterium]